MTKVLQSIFRSGQKLRHQRSKKVKFCRFRHFSDKSVYSSETRRARKTRKKGFDSSFNARLTNFNRLELRPTVWPSEVMQCKIADFHGNCFFCNNSSSKGDRETIRTPSCLSHQSSRRVEWYIIWHQKVKFKIGPQVKVMTWQKKVMLHINLDETIRLDETNTMNVFWSLYLVPVKSYCSKTIIDFWWRHVTCNVS